MGEMRPGLFHINWTIPCSNKKYYDVPKGSLELCSTQLGVSGRRFSIHCSPKTKYLPKKDVHEYIVTLNEVLNGPSPPLNPVDSTISKEQPNGKLVDLLKVMEPEIPRPFFIWIHVGSWLSTDPIHLIEKNAVQWQVDCVGQFPQEINLFMDFGINTMLEKKIPIGLSVMLKNQTNCDVQIHLKNGQSVGAHAAILSAGSPVLASMFQSNFVESITRQVNMKKTEPHVFLQLLFFLYTGSVPKLTEIDTIRSLLKTAVFYDVVALQHECYNMLQIILGIDNAVEMLILCHLKSIPSPKVFDAAMKFVVKNSRHIFSQPEWMELVKNHPELCVKVNQCMAATMLPNPAK